MSAPGEIRIRVESSVPAGKSMAIDFLKQKLRDSKVTQFCGSPRFSNNMHLSDIIECAKTKLSLDNEPDICRFVVEEMYGEHNKSEISSVCIYRERINLTPIIDSVWMSDNCCIHDPFWKQKLNGLALAHVWLIANWPIDSVRRLRGLEGVTQDNYDETDDFQKIGKEGIAKETDEVRRLGSYRLHRDVGGRVMCRRQKNAWIGALDAKREMLCLRAAYEFIHQPHVHLVDRFGRYRDRMPLRFDLDVVHQACKKEIQHASAAKMFHSGFAGDGGKFVSR